MIQFATLLLLGSILCAPAFGAATVGATDGYTGGKAVSAKNRLKSAIDNPSKGSAKGGDSSAKGRLKAATSDGPMEGYTWEKSSSAKRKMNEAAEAPPGPITYQSDKLNCGFLTKPLLRADGGGLNAHAGGSVTCHMGRIMHCLNGVWNDRGPCDWPENKQAYWVEGSPPPGTPPEESKKPEEPDGSNQAGGSGAQQGGHSILLGNNPREQQLEQERQQLLDEVQRLQQLQGGSPSQGQRNPGTGSGNRMPPQGQGSAEIGTGNRMPLTGGGNAPLCAQAKEAIAVTDGNMRQIEAYSRATTTVPGAIHPTYQAAYNAAMKDHARAEQYIRENNCN
ncbi:MAG: hypothetical protein WAO76_10455 [Georgfuchsia sp.]